VEKVEDGSFVSVDYKGILENGQVFDTSYGRQPIEIQMGAGQLLKGFEKRYLPSHRKTLTGKEMKTKRIPFPDRKFPLK
jgi:peptidylprolyl isomerase